MGKIYGQNLLANAAIIEVLSREVSQQNKIELHPY